LRHQRRGFTLIEVLVVIGIMMTLIAILILGMRHLNATMATKETISELHICRGMLTEYETHSGMANIETTTVQVKDASAPPPSMFPVYQDTSATNKAFIALIDVTGDMGDRAANSIRYSSNAVMRTQDVMFVLMRIPANRTLVQSVQNKRILEPASGAAPAIDQGPVLLDGWGNPIIFVPAGGIHVNIKDPANPSGPPTDYIMRSTGMFLASQLSSHASLAADRPFFASAGQDGDFSIGEDNVYSFQD
jgi:type II secretory pathway pseudopilin PulG